jgi:type I restriction enzyme S subunit
MEPATAALFPDRFGEDGLPEGWRAGVVADLVAFNPRETLRKDAPAPYLDMKALPTIGARAEHPITRPFTSGTKFRRGDVLLARITPCLENGKAALVDTVPRGEVAWGSTEFIVMRGKAGATSGLVYCLVRHTDFRDCAVQSMVGSSGRQRVQQERLERFPLAVPPRGVLDAFGRATDPMFATMTARGDEAETLANLRDTLLPKLMSGELRVREADALVAEVA